MPTQHASISQIQKKVTIKEFPHKNWNWHVLSVPCSMNDDTHEHNSTKKNSPIGNVVNFICIDSLCWVLTHFVQFSSTVYRVNQHLFKAGFYGIHHHFCNNSTKKRTFYFSCRFFFGEGEYRNPLLPFKKNPFFKSFFIFLPFFRMRYSKNMQKK